MPLSNLSRTLQSQLLIARLNHPLWSFRHVLGGLKFAKRWFINPDGTAPTPLAIAWYLTHACPENCDFCNVSRALKEEQPHLRFTEARSLIDTLVPKIPVVALGGGEPMAHPDVIDIIHHIRSKNGRVFVVTSGTPVGPGLAKALCKAEPEMIMISLLGPEAIHDSRMGRTGAFKRTVAALDHIQRNRNPRKTRLIINCTISPKEYAMLDEVVEIGRSLKVDAVRFSWLSFMSPEENQKKPTAEPYFVLPAEEIAGFEMEPLIQKLTQIRKQWPQFVQFLPNLSQSELAAWFNGSGVQRHCLSLWHTLFLRPDSIAVPCGHMQNTELGSVLEQPLEGIWNSNAFKAIRLAQRQEAFQMCGRCCKV